jgi:Peptidase C13 family
LDEAAETVPHCEAFCNVMAPIPRLLPRLLAAICLVLALVASGAVPGAAAAERWQAVLVAGDTAQPVFDNAVRAVNLWLAEHGVAAPDIHRLSASAGPGDPAVEPATLAQVLGRIGGLRARPGEGCFVFITSHGGRGEGIYLSRNDEILRPDALARVLAAGCAAVPTVVVISGCYSGSFAQGAMTAPNRIVLTAARSDRSSFGCTADRIYTVFDACLLGVLPHAATWRAVFDETKDCVQRRERQDGETPSLPQAWFGAAVRKLPLQF